MWFAVYLQIVITIAAAVAAGLIVGLQGAVSAAAGGLAYALPSLLFVWRLKIGAKRPGLASPATFFVGEFVKIALTVVLLLLTVKTYAELHWPSFLIGLGLALQAGLLAFWKKS